MRTTRASAEVLGSITLPGLPDAPVAVRRYLRDRLPGHPALYDLTLCVTELVTNAIVHTASGTPGGSVTVTITRTAGEIRADVSDDGGTPSDPHVVRAADAENGRGLCILDALAERWGVERRGGGANVWFTLNG